MTKKVTASALAKFEAKRDVWQEVLARSTSTRREKKITALRRLLTDG